MADHPDQVPEAGALVGPLLHWYEGHARTLPWRSEPTPYNVLLSELMLQQTRVDTVIPYFGKFRSRWPTLEDLAAASEEAVLEAWAGLGYYSRARNLLKAARAASEQGGLPSDPKALQRLPGIGPYTAGAIASIAHGVAAPLVDGNVERVLSRVDGRVADPRSTGGKKALWTRADELVSVPEAAARPGDWNQALMELGATVCTPREPSCLICPWTQWCEARRTGRQRELPKVTPKKKPVPIVGVSVVATKGQDVLVARRVPGLLGGLWEPVRFDGQEASCESDATDLLRECGLVAGSLRECSRVRHTFSHRKLTLTVFECTVQGEPRLPAYYDDWRFAQPEDLALSKLARKVLASAGRSG